MKLRGILPADSERRTAFIASAFLFCILSAFILLRSARDAFFLSSYSSRFLPYAMTLNTIVSAIAALIFLRLYRFFSLPRVLRVTFVLFIAGSLLFWHALTIHFPRAQAALYLWVGIYGTIAPVQGWTLVALKFSMRQARRLAGIVGGGAVLGAVAGGMVARLLAHIHHSRWLLPSAALFMFFAIIFSLILSPPINAKEETPATPAIKIPQNYRRFALLLLLIVAIGTVVSAFVDFEFKTVVQRQMKSVDHLAGFFGSFYAYMGAGTLLLQFAVTPYLMRRVGIAGTLSVLPLSLFIGNAAVLNAGLFKATLLMRGSEELFKYSVDRSSLEVLYVAIPEQAKVRLKSAIDTIGVRLPEALASVFLIALFSVGKSSVHFLFLINAVLLVCWVGCAMFLGKREYPRLLKEEIQRKEIDLESVKSNLFTLDFYRLLPQLFQNGEKQTVLDLLELLQTSGKRWLGRYVAVALNRQEKDLKIRALQMLFYQDGNLSGSIRSLAGDSDRALRTEAIHYICSRSKGLPPEFQSWMESEDLSVRAAAASALCKKGESSASGYAALEEIRQAAMQKGDLEARLEIAHVLEFIKPSNLSADLYEKLLSDSALEVRRAALRSIASSRPVGIIKPLLRLMNIPALSADVRFALAAYGTILIPDLTKVLEEPGTRVLRKKTALQIAADIGAPSVLPFILQTARHKNVMLRFQAIKALNRLKQKHPQLRPAEKTIRGLLDEEVNRLTAQLKRIRDFSPRPDGLLANVLHQRYVWAVERIFRLIGLLKSGEQRSIYYTYLAWNSTDTRLRDAALDFMEQQIDEKSKAKILPLLERFPSGSHPKDETSRKEAALYWFAQREPLLSGAIIADLTDEELQAWRLDMEERLGEPNHPLIVEILNRRKEKMENGEKSTQREPFSTIEKMEHLGKIDVFSRLGSHELLLLADQAVEVEFQSGARIFSEGEIASDAYSVLQGEVILERASKPLSSVAPGESFGTLELLSDQPRLFSAIAKEDSLCLKIEREIFWEILEDYPAVSRSILEVLVHQVRALTDKIAESITA